MLKTALQDALRGIATQRIANRFELRIEIAIG